MGNNTSGCLGSGCTRQARPHHRAWHTVGAHNNNLHPRTPSTPCLPKDSAPLETDPLPTPTSQGDRESLEYRRTLFCKTEAMISWEGLKVLQLSLPSSGPENRPSGLLMPGCSRLRRWEGRRRRLQAVPSLRGHLSSCCCRLVPCHRSEGPAIPGDSAQQQRLPPPPPRPQEQLRKKALRWASPPNAAPSESLWQGHAQSPISWGMTTATAHPNPTVAEGLVSALLWVI